SRGRRHTRFSRDWSADVCSSDLRGEEVMASITASVYTSHVPAIGAALDLGKTHEPYWQKVFAGYEFSKQWLKDNCPDVIFLVYKDRKSTRLNSSHVKISYAVFCL